MSVELEAGLLLANRFLVIEKVGQGAMGTVWLATDTHLNDEQVACKVLSADLADDKRALAELKQEVLLSRRLRHPNIVPVHTFWDTGEIKFVTMDYTHGKSLAQILAERNQPFSIAEALPILGQLCNALQYAHGRQVLHRDIKPANIVLGHEGTAFLVDFGLARTFAESGGAPAEETTSGTVMYMSPEQLRGEPLDPSSDLYSLASTAYEMLSGRPPFHTGAILAQIQMKNPDPLPCLSAASNRALLRALAKRPSDRQSSCAEFLAEFSECADESAMSSGVPAGPRHDPDAQTRVMPSLDRAARKNMLGTLLVEAGLITQEHLEDALARQAAAGGKIGTILVQLGHVTQEAVARALAEQLHIPFVRLSDAEVDPRTAGLVSRDLACKHSCLLLRINDDRIVAAMADPLDFDAINEIESLCGAQLDVCVATDGDVEEALARLSDT